MQSKDPCNLGPSVPSEGVLFRHSERWWEAPFGVRGTSGRHGILRLRECEAVASGTREHRQNPQRMEPWNPTSRKGSEKWGTLTSSSPAPRFTATSCLLAASKP